MYICLDCSHIFEEPTYYTETHGFTDGLYEHWNGCPVCSGTYAVAKECSQCGEYIKSDYIELKDGGYVCDSCYTKKDLGDD